MILTNSQLLSYELSKQLELLGAYYVLDFVLSSELPKLADSWITQGFYTDSILELSLEPQYGYSLADSKFKAVLEDKNIKLPTRVKASWIISKSTIEQMIDGSLELEKGANFLYWNIYREIEKELPKGEYVGSSMGFEQIFCWLREIWDCRDGSIIICHADLPREEAEKKFLEYLEEEIIKWNERYRQLDMQACLPCDSS